MTRRLRQPVVVVATISSILFAACTSSVSPQSPGSAAAASVAPSASLAAEPSVDASAEPQPDPSTAEPTAEPSEELPGTAGPGCGTGAKGFFAHRDEVPETLRFGGATIEFTGAGYALRNGTYQGDDAIPGGIGLSPKEIAVVVGPGDHILLRAPGLTLTDARAGSVAWSTVSFEGGLASVTGTTQLPRRLRGDGSISISAPTKVGDFAIEFGVNWHGTCLEGDGIAYSRIKVR